ncbi:MAG: GntR family transcriptional regulator [Chitinophagaceae bacterium]
MHRMAFVNDKSSKPKYRQIVQSVLDGIDSGIYKKGQLLPSINEMSTANRTAKETITKAYAVLKEQGIITARQGKGFYVSATKTRSGLNVFVLFDTFFAFKEILFRALKDVLPKDTSFNIFFHHYNVDQFKELIQNAVGNYHYYVIMPHFNTDVSGIIDVIPKEKLLLLDRDVPRMKDGYAAVYQDFERDVFQNLQSALPLIKKYKSLNLIIGTEHLQHVPKPVIKGYKKFCQREKVQGVIMENLEEKNIRPGEAYLIFHDTDMVHFIKICEKKKWKPGKDIGLISFDDTALKEILLGGISVFTTDFEKLGKTAGEMIKEKRAEKIANPSMFIKRKTL